MRVGSIYEIAYKKLRKIMITDKMEIENVLKEGRKILLERPELKRMNLHDVINELDDGTQEMLHNRWSVAAWLVINSLKSFKIKTLVEDLSEVDSGILTYEYAGYLLQKEYQVDMEKLILEADQCGKFDKIVLYVMESLIYETELHEEYLLPMLNMLERHKDYKGYHTFLSHYAKHITDMRAQKLAERILGDLSGETQYEFMRNMRWEWYQQDAVEANKVIGRMLERKSVWSKKIGIDFLESSLGYSIETFERYFFQVKELISASEELHQMIISLFVQYLFNVESEDLVYSEQIYHCVLDYLKKVPLGSLKLKRVFLEAIQWKDEISEELKEIFNIIIGCSVERDRQILDLLDRYLYLQVKKGKWREALQIMQKIFIANKYLAQYQDFFDCMDSVQSELRRYSAEITLEAIEYILIGGIDQLFFGVGLLIKIGDIQKLHDIKNESGILRTFTDAQMVHLMKGILYYAVDNKAICYMAFRLLEFSSESGSLYIEFCMKEVFENYPATMCEAAEHYKESEEEKQRCLADNVIKRQEFLRSERSLSYNIKDLQPSHERQYIYHRAQMEQNRRINKSANEQSVFAQLFSTKTMKYGERNAHVMTGRKDEKIYQVTPYMRHEYQVELPSVYVEDPVEFELRRRAYLEEVINNANGDKGLSTSVKRER